MDLRSIRANLASRNAGNSTRSSSAAMLSQQASAVKPQSSLLAALRKPAAWVRRHPRHPCCIIAVLDILDRGVPLDGLLTEISEGGALFRNASSFVFDRRKAPIALRFADREWRGEIVNVKPEGYGIRLDKTVSPAEIEHIIARYGMPTGADS